MIDYQELIERSRTPDNLGELTNPDIHVEDINPLCGDKVEIFVNIKNNVIDEIKFKGSGCSISKVSTDLLLDKIKGKSINDVKNLKNEDILNLLGIDISAMRLKCALLSLVAIKKGINNYQK